MEYQKELIQSRITKIKDPVQKVLLQDVLMDVFQIMTDYSEECYKLLEHKIDSELDPALTPNDIYTGVCETDQMDDTSRFLYPVETAEEEEGGSAAPLQHIFLASGHEQVKRCVDQIFPARIETEKNTYDLRIKLTRSEEYQNKIAWLYQQFHANKKPYRSICFPFLDKYLDVMDLDGTVPKGETIHKLILDFGCENPNVHTKISLLWNIQEFDADTSANIIPGEKTVLYEHKVELPADGSEYLAVFDPDETFYIIQYPEYLAVRTEKRGYDKIHFLRIVSSGMEKDTTQLFLPLQSNGRKLRHTDKQALRQPKIIFTYGEMHRMLSSYDAYQGMHLAQVEVKDKEEYKVQDCNTFIISHRFLRDRRILFFTFTAEDLSDILLYEKMVFLISEIQLLTDEYRCAGQIKDRKDVV